MKNQNQQKKIFDLVLGFFEGDEKKAKLWMNSPNPMLGNISPRYMIQIGRHDRLLKFVKNALSENKPPKKNKTA